MKFKPDPVWHDKGVAIWDLLAVVPGKGLFRINGHSVAISDQRPRGTSCRHGQFNGLGSAELKVTTNTGVEEWYYGEVKGR